VVAGGGAGRFPDGANKSVYNISSLGMRTTSINTNTSNMLDSYDQSMTSKVSLSIMGVPRVVRQYQLNDIAPKDNSKLSLMLASLMTVSALPHQRA
jgi:hypothetical protein